MSVWFEGEGDIACSIEDVKRAVGNIGELHVGVVGLMPGTTSVELVAATDNALTIKTSEGLMERTNITTSVAADGVILELDERYQAGSRVTASSHFRSEFITGDGGVSHRLVISDVAAPGFLGFLYRRFGSSNMGKAFLAAFKTYLERSVPAA